VTPAQYITYTPAVMAPCRSCP